MSASLGIGVTTACEASRKATRRSSMGLRHTRPTREAAQKYHQRGKAHAAYNIRFTSVSTRGALTGRNVRYTLNLFTQAIYKNLYTCAILAQPPGHAQPCQYLLPLPA